MKHMHYTIYWLTGKREVINAGEHHTFHDAATAYGYGNVAKLIDFYSYGIDTSYTWDSNTRTWNRNAPPIHIGHTLFL